jgi:hypothetical protein
VLPNRYPRCATWWHGRAGRPGEPAGGTQLARYHPGCGRCQRWCAGPARSAGYDLPLVPEVLRIERIPDLGFGVSYGRCMAKWTFSTKWPTQALWKAHQASSREGMAPSREGMRTTSQAQVRRQTYGCTEGHVAERRAEASQRDDSGAAK